MALGVGVSPAPADVEVGPRGAGRSGAGATNGHALPAGANGVVADASAPRALGARSPGPSGAGERSGERPQVLRTTSQVWANDADLRDEHAERERTKVFGLRSTMFLAFASIGAN